ncbi:MAG: endonuclease/exonuclease/phosphatase family protein [Mucilaginibacter sp.]
MKIITWNCNMAFRKKAELILQHRPDILIIPECEHPDKLKFPALTTQANDIVWHGDNQNKGLGVFSYGGYKLQRLPIHNPDFKTIIPISVTGGAVDFTLLAIWANNPADKGNQYIGQIWKAIHFYDDLIKSEKTILAGDFNSNSIWDKPRRIGNHTTMVNVLEAKQIRSAYHRHFSQTHGNEEHATFNLYKNPGKPYHLDYCFVSDDLMNNLNSVEIGRYDDWKPYSDHLPLIVNFDI